MPEICLLSVPGSKCLNFRLFGSQRQIIFPEVCLVHNTELIFLKGVYGLWCKRVFLWLMQNIYL